MTQAGLSNHRAGVLALDAADSAAQVGRRPRLLDLCCNAGQASVGYHRAGFDVVGVDIEAQPNYPFEFLREDALIVLSGAYDEWLATFDAVHASPPCQARTTMSNRWRGKGGRADEHVNLIPDFLARLERLTVPWVIENVPGARGDLPNAFTLTGGMFGLGVHRPRLFGSNVLVMVPPKAAPPTDAIGVYGKAHDGRLLWRRTDGTEQRAAASLEEAKKAMGVDYEITWDELREGIPPAYTEFIGRQLIDALDVAA